MGKSRVILVAAVSIALAGCAGAATDDGAEPEPEALSQVCTPDAASGVTPDGFEVTYTTAPDPIPLNAPFALVVDVENSAGMPPDLVVEANAEMPQHGHGMNTIAYSEADTDTPGRFHISGMQLHMPGTWKMYIDVTDTMTERLSFDVECIE